MGEAGTECVARRPRHLLLSHYLKFVCAIISQQDAEAQNGTQ